MFKNAQGQFDGRIFMGLMLGLGAGAGVVIKLWWTVSDSVPPFWLWAVPVVCIAVAALAYFKRRREHAQIRERLERSARIPRRPDRADEPDAPAA